MLGGPNGRGRVQPRPVVKVILWLRKFTLHTSAAPKSSTKVYFRFRVFDLKVPLSIAVLDPRCLLVYFRVRTFGSVDTATEHPKACFKFKHMEMAREMSGCIMGATIFGEMLIGVRPRFLAPATYREFKRRNPCSMYCCSKQP